MMTLRIAYTKENYMKFLGHLELMKLFERIFRVNNLPLKFSEGFNPIPKMTFAAPLSVGYSTKFDVMEVGLEEEVDLETIKNMKFPDGIEILDAKYIECKSSLMAKLEYAEYLIKVEFKSPVERLPFKEWTSDFLSMDTIMYEKKTKKGGIKSINLMEQIHKFDTLYVSENEWILKATLISGSNGSLNPEKFVELFLSHFTVPQEVDFIQVERMGLYFMRSGELTNLFDLKDDDQ